MRVTEIIQAAKKPLFTFELVPPLKGRTLEPILETIRTLMEFDPSYINVTNHQAEVVYLEREDGLLQRKTVRKRPGTTALAALIQHTFNVPTVAHVICGGMSREQYPRPQGRSSQRGEALHSDVRRAHLLEPACQADRGSQSRKVSG
jgi:methylenetetrahydrofolate reductase (NADPH)